MLSPGASRSVSARATGYGTLASTQSIIMEKPAQKVVAMIFGLRGRSVKSSFRFAQIAALSLLKTVDDRISDGIEEAGDGARDEGNK